MAATVTANKLNTIQKRDNYKCVLQRNTVPLKISCYCKRPPEIMKVPLKCMTANVPLK